MFWIWWDFSVAKQFKLRKSSALIYFWIVNSFSVWVVARFTDFTGFELAEFRMMFVAGLGLTVLQTLVWKLVVKRSSFLG